MRHEPLDTLQDALGWRFRDRELLERSLTHRSFCAEHPEVPSNERLEFLGDAVLGLVVAAYAFRAFPDGTEGELSEARAGVVNAEVLAELGAEVGLGPALRLGKGEDASGGRAKPSILSDAMEAVIAAVYVDGGWPAAEALVLRLLEDRIGEYASAGRPSPKSRLQELAVRVLEEVPRYRVRDDGPDHSKHFFASVLLRGEVRGQGEGRSKRQAEQEAARIAWQWLLAESGGSPPEDEHAGAT
ncbi:MAG: ribonuclease III [Acidimicrobiia bacterium]